jgi:hypothetical protein
MPRLHIYVYPKGHFEEIFDKDFVPLDPHWLRPITKYTPKD